MTPSVRLPRGAFSGRDRIEREPGADGADESALERVTMRRVSVRLLPFLFILYIGNYLDRTNVAMAALQMNRDLHFSATAYGLGAGIFFLGYCLLEVPSSIILARVGARRWIARIMISWGVIASAMLFVRTPIQFYSLRFLLGAAEAGFFPGIIYYLSQWFPARRRARAISLFAIAIPLSGAIGSPLSASLLGLDGMLTLAGWQWLFLLEGIPSVLLGLATLALLTNAPVDARWLSEPQRAWLVDRMRRDQEESGAPHGIPPLRALVQPLLWLVAMPFLLLCTIGYVYIFWAPTLIRDSLHASPLATGFILGGIACLAAAGMFLAAVGADRGGEHALRAAAGLALAALGCVCAAVLPTPIGRIGGLALAYIGTNAAFAPYWCIPPMLLRGSAAAAGIALVNSLGNLGGFLGPYAMGWLMDVTGSTRGAFLGAAVLGLIAAALCVVLRRRVAFATPARARRTRAPLSPLERPA